MKKSVIVFMLLPLIVCIVGWIMTNATLGRTNAALEEKEQALQETVENLSEAQNSLRDISKSLQETQQALEAQRNQTNEYMKLSESFASELKNQEEELNGLKQKLDSSEQKIQNLQNDIDGVNKELNESKDKLKLYEDTLGTKVYSDVAPPYKSGNSTTINLLNNQESVNPPWQELEVFLSEDKTDKIPYREDAYVCGNYAQDLHNNAEDKGIRTAFVVVHFYGKVPHALNAFKTSDRGLIFVDVTGTSSPISLKHLDKIVQVQKDKPYVPRLLIPEEGWGFEGPFDTVKSIEIYW